MCVCKSAISFDIACLTFLAFKMAFCQYYLQFSSHTANLFHNAGGDRKGHEQEWRKGRSHYDMQL